MRRLTMMLLAVLVVVAGCSPASLPVDQQGDVDATVSSDRRPEFTETSLYGYPWGTVQRAFLMYDGTLYVYADRSVTELLPSYQQIGSVKVVDNTKVPSQDFDATWLEEGMGVYKHPEESALFVQWTTTQYLYYVPYESPAKEKPLQRDLDGVGPTELEGVSTEKKGVTIS